MIFVAFNFILFMPVSYNEFYLAILSTNERSFFFIAQGVFIQKFFHFDNVTLIRLVDYTLRRYA